MIDFNIVFPSSKPFSLNMFLFHQYTTQEPLEHLALNEYIISKTTSSGIVKFFTTKNKAMILSPEVSDIINKLLKSDEISSFYANFSPGRGTHITT